MGKGSVPQGPAPTQRLPSCPSPILSQALSSPLINRPGLMVSLATFPQAAALGQPAFPSESRLLEGPAGTSRRAEGWGSRPPLAMWVMLPGCLGAQHCGWPAGRVRAHRLQGARGTLARVGIRAGPEQGGGPNTQSPATGHRPVRTGPGRVRDTGQTALCPQIPIQAPCSAHRHPSRRGAWSLASPTCGL